jgi:hypothetical protein
MATPKKINYLNNRDLLKEIHKSKNTYCYFTSDEFNSYDLIIDGSSMDLSAALEILKTPEQISLAKEKRAAKIFSETKEKIDPNSIPNEGLVFRVMTWDHIPVSQKQPRKTLKKKTAKDIMALVDDDLDDIFSDLEDNSSKSEIDDMVHVKVNFPPFQHFIIKDGAPICVGKSHWRNGLHNGEFCKDHGQITNKLAKMYIMLCEKYAMKYNWRGYTYRDEMEASAILQLTYVGLRFNEARSSNPFAYLTATCTNAFIRILNNEKRNQNIRDDILESHNLAPSMSRQMSGMKSGNIDE